MILRLAMDLNVGVSCQCLSHMQLIRRRYIPPAPPENPEVNEEFATDCAAFRFTSLEKSSSLCAFRDNIGFLSSVGGVPIRRSAPALPVKCRDKAAIFPEGEVERCRRTDHVSNDLSLIGAVE